MTLEETNQELGHGESPPGFELPGTDGETHTIEEFEDRRALLVVFTCNHCPYAQAKFGTLNDIAADYEDVAVVGINANDAEEYPQDSFEHMQELVMNNSIDYDAYLRDESQDTAAAYGAVCTPDPFLFTRGAKSASDGENAEAGTGEPASADGGFELVYHGRLDDAHGPDQEPSGEPGFEMREAIDSALAGDPIELEERPSQGCSIKWR